MVNINYSIADDLHREAKTAAARQGITLRQFVIDAVTEQVQNALGSKESAE